MAKFQVYATSTVDQNSYILLEAGTEVPYGYTEKQPPLPEDGFTVTWDDELSDWTQLEIPTISEPEVP